MKVEKVKTNTAVWKIEENGSYYALKKYKNATVYRKVLFIHNMLQAINFPHALPVLSTPENQCMKQRWLEESRPFSYHNTADCAASLQAIIALHKTSEVIEWKHCHPIAHHSPIAKWATRLLRFQQAQTILRPFLSTADFEQIVSYAEQALEKIANTQQARDGLTLLHGDIVHHNFLWDQEEVIQMIDFDLASIGQGSYEIALWVQRILPFHQYNLESILHAFQEIDDLYEEIKYLLLFPNELLREWLFFSCLPPNKQLEFQPKIQQFTKAALSHWPQLWYTVEWKKF